MMNKNLSNRLNQFFEPMGEPEPYDWLATFPEDGQTFAQYINSNPTLPTSERKIIYIQPIGKFNENELKIINLTAEYMKIFFQLETKLLEKKCLRNRFLL
jgi:archaemetzincin